MRAKRRKVLFVGVLVISTLILIYGLTHSRRISGEEKAIDNYELVEVKTVATMLCLSCMGVE